MKYDIIGGTVPYVQITLDQGRKVYTQSGGMSWRDQNFEMITDTKGGLFKGLGRMLSGDSLFMNTYCATQNGAQISFASTMPGEIIPIELDANHPGVIAQKSAFLVAEEGVELNVTLSKKIGAGLFGGEGFVLQDIHGNGTAFLEVDGNVCQKQLADGESILVDTGNVVCFDKTCKYEIETVKGVKNMLFGGEGFFLTKITGPGNVVLQSQNINELLSRIIPLLPKNNN